MLRGANRRPMKGHARNIMTSRVSAIEPDTPLGDIARLLAAGGTSAARRAASVRRVWRYYPLVREDYVAVVDADRLRPIPRVRGHVLVAVAARVGKARLIDNFEWSPR